MAATKSWPNAIYHWLVKIALIWSSQKRFVENQFKTEPVGEWKIVSQQFYSFQGVFDVDKEAGLTLIEIADDVQIEDIIASTGCEFAVSEDLKPMRQS